MQRMGMKISKVKAGKANMFLSPIFQEAFANVTGTQVELYNTDGSVGAARGAGIGIGTYHTTNDAFDGLQQLESIEPNHQLQPEYEEAYQHWLAALQAQLDQKNGM